MPDLSFGGIDPAAEAGGGGAGGLGSLLGGGGAGKDKSLDPDKMMQLAKLVKEAKSTQAMPPSLTARPPGSAGGSPGMAGFGEPSFSGLLDRLVRYKGTV